MKSLVNEKVSHNKFGTGKIVEETALKIWVQFSEAEQPKIFAFPIDFDRGRDSLFSFDFGEKTIIYKHKYEKSRKIRKFRKICEKIPLFFRILHDVILKKCVTIRSSNVKKTGEVVYGREYSQWIT